MEIIIKQQKRQDVKAVLSDVLMSITWRDIARTYFGKSSSWLYHKMDGISGNGTPDGFTEEEIKQLQGALYDLSDRIRVAAQKL